MKKIRLVLHILLPILILCTSVNSIAQIKFGVKAGGNYTNVKYVNESGTHVYTYPKTGYQFGIFADIPISRNVFFQPSLLVSSKGYNEDRKVYISGDTIYITATFRPRPIYVEVPLNMYYKYQLKKIAFFAGGGPFVSYGFNSKYKFIPPKGFEAFVIPTGKIQFLEDFWNVKSGYVQYQRHVNVGAGASIGAGFMKHFSVTVGAQYGLLNVYPYANGTRPVKASIAMYEANASVGYRF